MQQETSAGAQGEPTIDSVFDFLYHDGRRVASFLAQFDPSGSLTQISAGKHIEQSHGDTLRVEGTLGVTGLAKGSMASSDEVRNKRQDEIMRVYDPMWSNARALLDLLDERGMLQRDLDAAHLGHMVLFSGSLDIYDLKMMAGMWQMKSIRALMSAGANAGQKLSEAQSGTANGKRTKADQAAVRREAREHVELISELIPALPHSSHGVLTLAGQQKLWFNFDPSGLSTTPAEIILKHGVAVPGTWAVLGILDAMPEPMEHRSSDESTDGAEAVSKIFEALAPVIRTMFGRPERAYGITPLLIFRETARL